MKEIIDFNERIVKQFVEALRPEDIEMRKKIDFGYSYQNNAFELFEVRPSWSNPNEKIKGYFAKFKFVKTQQVWKLYWRLSNGKWTTYGPLEETKDLFEVFEEIKKDPYNCFFG